MREREIEQVSGMEIIPEFAPRHKPWRVLYLSSLGRETDEIAQMMGLAVNTVNSYRSVAHAWAKISGPLAVIEALDRGYIPRVLSEEYKSQLPTPTASEFNLITMVVSGWTDRQIAAELKLPLMHIKRSVRNLFRKYRASSPNHLARVVYECGFFDEEFTPSEEEADMVDSFSRSEAAPELMVAGARFDEVRLSTKLSLLGGELLRVYSDKIENWPGADEADPSAVGYWLQLGKICLSLANINQLLPRIEKKTESSIAFREKEKRTQEDEEAVLASAAKESALWLKEAEKQENVPAASLSQKIFDFLNKYPGAYFLYDDLVPLLTSSTDQKQQDIAKVKISEAVNGKTVGLMLEEQGLCLHANRYKIYGEGRHRRVLVALPKDDEPAWPLWKEQDASQARRGKKSEQKKTKKKRSKSRQEKFMVELLPARNLRKEFSWEPDIKEDVLEATNRLIQSGVDPKGRTHISNEQLIEKLRRGKFLDEDEAISGELNFDSVVLAVVSQTHLGNRIFFGEHGEYAALANRLVRKWVNERLKRTAL